MITACPSCGRANRLPASRLDARARCGGCKHALVPLTRPVEITSARELDELVQGSPLPVVLDFWAPWCGPCRMVGPELEVLAKRQAGRTVFAKVNSDDLADVAERFHIRGIPTLVRLDGGAETKRISGAQRADAIGRSLGLDAGPSVDGEIRFA